MVRQEGADVEIQQPLGQLCHHLPRAEDQAVGLLSQVPLDGPMYSRCPATWYLVPDCDCSLGEALITEERRVGKDQVKLFSQAAVHL